MIGSSVEVVAVAILMPQSHYPVGVVKACKKKGFKHVLEYICFKELNRLVSFKNNLS